MDLFKFILGVLGVLLIIGAFSSFLPLVLLGGLATGSFTFAFGFPILLMIVGATMVYFGFYYTESSGKSNGEVGSVIKWGIVCTIAILISNYIISKLLIVNTLLATLFTALLVSILIQIVKSQEDDYYFKMKWFIFYFLVYSNVIWLMGEYVFPQITFQTSFFSSLVLGFSLAGIYVILKKMNLRSHSIPWVSVVLVLVLLVANGQYLSDFTSINLFQGLSQNASGLSEKDQNCPTPSLHPIFNGADDSITTTLNGLIDSSVWRTENYFNQCYMGKYKNQNPTWFYCDNLIVSRWELSESGNINYRWYTAVTAELKPLGGADSIFTLNEFLCENGQKVTVEKGKANYYVYVSRDGTPISIQY